MLETLKPYPRSKLYGPDKIRFEMEGGTVDQYNDRFGQWSQSATNLNGLMVDRIGEGIVDIQSRKFIVKRLEFSSGPRGAGVFWKSWLNRSTCNRVDAVRTAAFIRLFTVFLR